MNNTPLSESVATKSDADTDANKVGTEENQEIAQNVQVDAESLRVITKV